MEKSKVSEIIRKSLLFGVGVGVLTKEAIQKAVRDYERRGHITAKEGKKLVLELQKKTKQQEEKLKKGAEVKIKKMIASLPFATKKEISELHKKIDAMKKKGPAKKPVKKSIKKKAVKKAVKGRR